MVVHFSWSYISYAAAVLDPYTHYQYNMSKNSNYDFTLTDAIEKIADPEIALLANNEIKTYRDCLGRFDQRSARCSAETMSPSKLISTCSTLILQFSSSHHCNSIYFTWQLSGGFNLEGKFLI